MGIREKIVMWEMGGGVKGGEGGSDEFTERTASCPLLFCNLTPHRLKLWSWKPWLGDFGFWSHLSLYGIYGCPVVPDEGHHTSRRLVLHELLSTQ